MRDEELLALMRTARDASMALQAARRRLSLCSQDMAVAQGEFDAADERLRQAQAALVAKVCPAA